MANRDDPWARFRRLVTTWLRTPSTWRGLLLAVLLGGAFTWGVIVLGIALTMAASGAEQWWLVLVFGGAVLAMMLASGYLLFNRGNRGIAAELYIATGTVKAHLNHIFRKLEARSRLQAVTRARELRLLAERDPK
jgi:DNA-binding CsgD family transcriptional regulator